MKVGASRYLRFSLAQLLVALTLFAASLAGLKYYFDAPQRERAAEERLVALARAKVYHGTLPPQRTWSAFPPVDQEPPDFRFRFAKREHVCGVLLRKGDLRPHGSLGLSTFPQLTHAGVLAGCRLSEEQLEEIVACRGLKQLTIRGAALDRDKLERLLERPDLSCLELQDCDLDDADLTLLAKIKGLTALNLEKNKSLQGRGVRLADWPALSSAVFSDCRLEAGFFQELNRSRLTSLSLFNMDLSDELLEEISRCDSIMTLDFYSSRMSPNGLKAIARMKSLRSIALVNTRVKAKELFSPAVTLWTAPGWYERGTRK